MVDFAVAFNAASGVLLMALGLFIAVAKPRTRVSVTLAVFVFFFGLGWAINYGRPLVSPGSSDSLSWFVPFAVAELVASIALVDLAGRFPRKLAPNERALLRWPVALAVAFVGGRLLDVDGSQALDVDGIAGPMVRAVLWAAFFYAILVMTMRFAAATGPTAPGERRQHALLAGALVLYPGTVMGLMLSRDTPSVSGGLLGAGLLAVASVVWIRSTRRTSGAERRLARNMALLCIGVPLASLILSSVQGGYTVTAGGLPPGLARTLSVVVLAYAILRQQLLGVDVKVRWTIKQSTIGCIFIAVFFIVSETAQLFFSGSTGPYIGIVAAGALVFALSPLQRVAERVAATAVPVAPGMPPSSRTADVYRATVRRLYADGELSRDDQRILAHLAQELGIGAGDALELRHEVEGERVAAKPKRARRRTSP